MNLKWNLSFPTNRTAKKMILNNNLKFIIQTYLLRLFLPWRDMTVPLYFEYDVNVTLMCVLWYSTQISLAINLSYWHTIQLDQHNVPI